MATGVEPHLGAVGLGLLEMAVPCPQVGELGDPDVEAVEARALDGVDLPDARRVLTDEGRLLRPG